jgi:hypothetical protein
LASSMTVSQAKDYRARSYRAMMVFVRGGIPNTRTLRRFALAGCG